MSESIRQLRQSRLSPQRFNTPLVFKRRTCKQGKCEETTFAMPLPPEIAQLIAQDPHVHALYESVKSSASGLSYGRFLERALVAVVEAKQKTARQADLVAARQSGAAHNLG